MESSHLAAFYNAAPIILWVEDLVTKVYLDALWEHDSRFQLYVGGGHEVLAAVVHQAQHSGRSHVYCLRDRDFGPTNRDRWNNPDIHAFALDTFEVECFLLDPPALAECAVNTSGHDEDWIEQKLLEHARDLVWWMACRKVIAGLREARQIAFPKHPKPLNVRSRADAEQILFDNDWVRTTVPSLGTRVDATLLGHDLTRAHAHYTASLGRGTWSRDFSGKEIVNELVTRLFTKQRPRGNAAIQDLAKAVAHQQLRRECVPTELLELREAMLRR